MRIGQLKWPTAPKNCATRGKVLCLAGKCASTIGHLLPLPMRYCFNTNPVARQNIVLYTALMAALCLCGNIALAQKPNKPMKRVNPGTLLKQTNPTNSPLLTTLLQANPQAFKPVLDNMGQNKLQIIYTQINRTAKGTPVFTHHYFNLSPQYFYPASTVKLPAAVVALEKLNNLRVNGLNKFTTMLTDSLRANELPVLNDPTADSGKPCIAHYIKKILLVSDNDAYNRLYEFVGQQPLNERLQQLGFKDAQLLHRLSISLTEAQNRHTNAVRFTDSLGNTVYSQPAQVSQLRYASRHDLVGKGYMRGGSFYAGETLVDTPMNFSQKNKWPLQYHHQLVQWIMFPESQPKGSRLNLTPDDYAFLQTYMGMLPAESSSPSYDSTNYWPTYVKFLLMGSQKGAWPNSNLKIYNKVGDAYGFLIDAAYIENKADKVSFMLSAMLYCNADEILNDDKYDYDTVGLPFMKQLGQVLYDYELAGRKKAN
ncbi:MAG: hypothetical protein EAY75_02760 [Bacteroidetes bacterium]|nr:MAG: hypothetical protein EAY75_02760 [Bacteroidota bacterium]